jgi:LmbE family N-acetylglucosaminyl deacetylase
VFVVINMSKPLRRFALAASLIAAASLTLPAQMRVVPLDDEQGHVALGLALRHLSNVGIFMHTTAHPDDENNALLVMLNRGQGFRTALATATRGNGGQNEIGPEIFEALGVLRTGELAALHRFDGAEQYFTRAVDFGYSFGIDETFEKWGRTEITSDYVRLIRMIRPDVVIALPPTGNAGGQHHMASSVITHDAVKLAGDATKFPEQIKDGLHAWQPKKFYESAGFGFPGEPQTPGPLTRVNSSIYDPLLGKTYTEIGIEARSMHKCQGMGQLLALPGTTGTASYRLVESTLPAQAAEEKSLFDGIDTTVAGLAKFVPGKPPKELTEGLTAITGAVLASQKAFDTQNDEATLPHLINGLRAVRTLRRQLRTLNIDDAAKFEIDFRLRQKEGEFQKAAILANGITVDVLADDGIVVPGQPVKVNVIVANHGAAEVVIKQVKIGGFEGDATCSMVAFTASPFGFPVGRGRGAEAPAAAMSTLRKDQTAHCEPALTIPAAERITEPYWHRKDFGGRYTFDDDAPFGLPFRPTPFYAQVTLGLPGGEEIIDGLPVQHRYQGNIFSGEKRTDLLVVPALSVRVSPEIAIVPADAVRPAAAPTTTKSTRTAAGRGRGAAAAAASAPAKNAPSPTREIRVTVVNDTNGPKESSVKLQMPAGWTAAPPQQSVSFTRADESLTVRFVVKPSPVATPGAYRVQAVATSGSQSFDRGYEVIEYPHISRYHIYDSADTTLKILDVKTAPNLVVGYVMGVGDQVPSAIEQLGAKVEMISADDLAWGNLSRFDVIVTGVRAYERREDLRANNSRLLDYVKNGGLMIVQYNKFEFNDAQYGPYPAKVSANRITDEGAPVKVLEPENKVFTQPNRIQPSAWNGWVQERGLYFLGEKDSRYKDLLEMEDQFPYNKGVKDGALVEATYGKGKWIYVGLNFWRQLPEGTDGAYQLFANLLSVGKTTAPVVPAIKGK